MIAKPALKIPSSCDALRDGNVNTPTVFANPKEAGTVPEVRLGSGVGFDSGTVPEVRLGSGVGFDSGTVPEVRLGSGVGIQPYSCHAKELRHGRGSKLLLSLS